MSTAPEPKAESRKQSLKSNAEISNHRKNTKLTDGAGLHVFKKLNHREQKMACYRYRIAGKETIFGNW